MQEFPAKTTRASKGQGTYGLFYASQVQQIKEKLGDLEGIRKNLGMSRRQICQILLVNPSAWTRWTKSSQGAPPHFYRALEWLIYIHSKKTNHQQNSPFLNSSSPSVPLEDLGHSHSASELEDASLQDTSSQDMTEDISQPVYGKAQNNLTYSLKSLDFIEKINKESNQGLDQIKLLRRQISQLKWFVIFLWGCVFLLLIRLFARGFI